MEITTQNPFAILSLIAAPAVLTNAASLLALSTSNRFLRAGERFRAVAGELEKTTNHDEKEFKLVHMNRIELQATLLLGALKAIYVALGAFMAATLIDILGAGIASRQWHPWDDVMMFLGLTFGMIGASSLVWGCVTLFRATRLSMMNIAGEASLIRRRMEERNSLGT